MVSVRIVNASPLILLGKIRRLEFLFVDEPKVVVPSTTFSEVAPLQVATSLPGWHPGLPPIAVDFSFAPNATDPSDGTATLPPHEPEKHKSRLYGTSGSSINAVSECRDGYLSFQTQPSSLCIVSEARTGGTIPGRKPSRLSYPDQRDHMEVAATWCGTPRAIVSFGEVSIEHHHKTNDPGSRNEDSLLGCALSHL